MMHLGGHSDNTDGPSRMNVVKNYYFRMPVMKLEAKFQAIALYSQIYINSWHTMSNLVNNFSSG